MKKLKTDLQSLTKEIDALTKQTKKLTDQLKKKVAGQFEKALEAMKPEMATRKTADAVKSLTKTIEKITKAIEKFEKNQASKKPTTGTKAKAKTTRTAPAKKKPSSPTATDQVLRIIRRSKKGVDVSTLISKTGFHEKKVRAIVSTAFKQGKIKRTGRGIYVGTER